MLFEYLKDWLAKIQNDYGVNPIIFAAIYFGGAPFFWFAIYKIIAGLRNRNIKQVRIFGIILGITIIAPFVYVAIFGHNVPYWFWIFAAVIIAYAIYNAFRRIK